jgi:hypothetical protein
MAAEIAAVKGQLAVAQEHIAAKVGVRTDAQMLARESLWERG